MPTGVSAAGIARVLFREASSVDLQTAPGEAGRMVERGRLRLQVVVGWWREDEIEISAVTGQGRGIVIGGGEAPLMQAGKPQREQTLDDPIWGVVSTFRLDGRHGRYSGSSRSAGDLEECTCDGELLTRVESWSARNVLASDMQHSRARF